MKKILIAAIAILSVQMAGAQGKTPEAAKAAVDKADAAVAKAEAAYAAKPNKPVKATVYIAQAKAYMDAYNAPFGNGMLGQDRTQVALLMTGTKPKSSEVVELSGEQFTKDAYKSVNYYYNANNILAIIEVTKPVDKEALEKSLQAYAKAAAVDTKGAKTKDIKLAIADINEKFITEAYNQYTFGKIAEASVYFEKAAAAKATAPVSEFDSTAVYNAGFTAWIAGDNDRALKFFNDCYNAGYYYEEGEVYSKLNDIYGKKGDAAKGVEYLKEGFVKFPQSQSILVNLINYYLTTGEDTDELFRLLDKAKANDPSNASLYYVEGNTYAKLGKKEEAIASYKKSLEVNPEYEFGYVGQGILYYEEMIAIAEEANALDYSKWREYDALMVKYYEAAEQAVTPFMLAYETSKDESLKYNIAQYIRDISFRLRQKGEQYNATYEQFDAIVKAGQN